MSKIFVLAAKYQPLNPIQSGKARILLAQVKPTIYPEELLGIVREKTWLSKNIDLPTKII